MQNRIRFAAASILLATLALAQDRRRPPANVGCDRSELTSYTGVLKIRSSGKTRVKLTIQTDAGPVETITVPVKSITGQSVKTGERVTVWICTTGPVTIEREADPLPR